jgi:hypothetical protein
MSALNEADIPSKQEELCLLMIWVSSLSFMIRAYGRIELLPLENVLSAPHVVNGLGTRHLRVLNN